MSARHYVCPCGYEFEHELGAYGCPDCLGDSGAAELVDDPYPLYKPDEILYDSLAATEPDDNGDI